MPLSQRYSSQTRNSQFTLIFVYAERPRGLREGTLAGGQLERRG